MSDLASELVASLSVDVTADVTEALETVAATLDPAPIRQSHGGEVVWLMANQPIVVLSGAAVSFRVGPEIGSAARNTPEAGVSSLGLDWVAFSPTILDGHGRDRLQAWFAAAYRRARTTTR